MAQKSIGKYNNCLTIITARGGSTGLPGKNIMPLCGKPLIAWTIQAAIAAKMSQCILVSSDDPKILEISAHYGAYTPFVRSADLATASATSMSVVLDALNFFFRRNIFFTYTMLLQPTSPLRTGEDIDACLNFMQTNQAQACVSVCEPKKSPYLMYYMDNEKHLKPVLPPIAATRRQDYPTIYTPNGAIYLYETAWLLDKKTFINEETVAFVMPEERSVDIDYLSDMYIAEFFLCANTKL